MYVSRHCRPLPLAQSTQTCMNAAWHPLGNYFSFLFFFLVQSSERKVMARKANPMGTISSVFLSINLVVAKIRSDRRSMTCSMYVRYDASTELPSISRKYIVDVLVFLTFSFCFIEEKQGRNRIVTSNKTRRRREGSKDQPFTRR